MRVRVIRQFLNGSKTVSEGTELVVSERRAADLERNKLVVPIGVGERERARRAARQAGAVDPTTDTDVDLGSRAMAETSAELPAGGQTGEAKPPSSSRRGRPRATRRSSSGEGTLASSR